MSEVKYKNCPKCGAQMQIEEGVMTSSIPPKYRYHCPVCGGLEFDTERYPMPEVINDLTIHPYPDLTRDFDWQAFRAEAAKDLLCAFITTPNTVFDKDSLKLTDVAENAIKLTDWLIKQLKEDE